MDLKLYGSPCDYLLSPGCIVDMGKLRRSPDLCGKNEEGWKEQVDSPQSAFLS